MRGIAEGGRFAQVEAPCSPAEFGRFERGLIAARMANGWGQHPWPGATDHERFLLYVERIGNGFTVGGGSHLGRLPSD